MKKRVAVGMQKAGHVNNMEILVLSHIQSNRDCSVSVFTEYIKYLLCDFGSQTAKAFY